MDEHGNDKRTNEGTQAVSPGRQALSELRAIRKSPLCSRCKAILVAIVLRQDAKSGITYTGQRRLSRDAGVRMRTVGFLLPVLQQAGIVKVIKRRNRTALRTVNVAAIKTSQKCTHARSEKAGGDISRLMDWKRRHAAKQEMPVLAKQDLPRAGKLSPFLSPYLSPPLGAPGGARSPSPALGERVGLAVCETTAGKNSVEKGNGMSKVFDQKLLTITEEQDEQIRRFIPNSHERDAQYNALHNTLKKPVADPVTAMKQWMETAPTFFES